MATKIKIFLLFLFFASGGMASGRSFYVNSNSYEFNHIVNEISNEVYAKLRNKFILLQSNYILEKNNNKYEFYSYDSNVCNKNNSVKTMVAGIEYQKLINLNGVVHNIVYKGCSGKTMLYEKIFSDDKENILDLSDRDILNISRTFGLSSKESLRRHVFMDPETNVLLFEIETKKNDDNLYYQIKSHNQGMIKVQQSKTNLGYNNINLIKLPYAITFRKDSYTGQYSTDSTLDYSILTTNKGISFIRKASVNPLTEKDYIYVYSSYFIARITNVVDSIFGYYFKLLPTTQVVQIQSANNVMLNELQEAYLRVTNKENLDLVAQLLKRYIQDVKDGKIQDNRQ